MTRLLAALSTVLLLAGCLTQSPAPSVDRTPSAQSKAPAATSAPVPAGPGYYTVKKGDTLYRVALEHGQDYRDIAGWNNLTNPDNIKEGQVLRVLPPGDNGTVVARPVVAAPVVESRPLDKGPVQNNTDSAKHEPRVNKEPYSDEAYARLGRNGDAPAPKVETKPEVAPTPVPTPATTSAPASADDIGWAWPSGGKILAPYSESGNRGLDIGGRAGDPVLSAGEGKVVYAGSGLRGYGQLVIVKHNNTFLSAYAHNQKILVKEGQQVGKGQKIAEMGNTDSDVVKLHFEIRRQGKPIDPLTYLPKR